MVPTKGTFGTVLRASLPEVAGDSGYITGLSLTLARNFSANGKRRSYLSAGCPAARASFVFGKRSLTSTLTRSCGARG